MQCALGQGLVTAGISWMSLSMEQEERPRPPAGSPPAERRDAKCRWTRCPWSPAVSWGPSSRGSAKETPAQVRGGLVQEGACAGANAASCCSGVLRGFGTPVSLRSFKRYLRRVLDCTVRVNPVHVAAVPARRCTLDTSEEGRERSDGGDGQGPVKSRHLLGDWRGQQPPGSFPVWVPTQALVAKEPQGEQIAGGSWGTGVGGRVRPAASAPCVSSQEEGRPSPEDAVLPTEGHLGCPYPRRNTRSVLECFCLVHGSLNLGRAGGLPLGPAGVLAQGSTGVLSRGCTGVLAVGSTGALTVDPAGALIVSVQVHLLWRGQVHSLWAVQVHSLWALQVCSL